MTTGLQKMQEKQRVSGIRIEKYRFTDLLSVVSDNPHPSVHKALK